MPVQNLSAQAGMPNGHTGRDVGCSEGKIIVARALAGVKAVCLT